MSQEANEAQTPMPAYRSNKKVWALKIERVENLGVDSTVDENLIVRVHFYEKRFAPIEANLCGKPTPEKDWYFVSYENGYCNFSSEKVFEEGNELIAAGDNAHGSWHGIGWAVKQMQDGMRVCRANWNGKGMFLFLVAGSTFKVNRAPLNTIYAEGTEVTYCAHVDMKTADGKIIPWLASQADLLAVDWEIAG